MCSQSPVTHASSDRLILQTCHHFAPSYRCYRRYLHSPWELDMTQSAVSQAAGMSARLWTCRKLRTLLKWLSDFTVQGQAGWSGPFFYYAEKLNIIWDIKYKKNPWLENKTFHRHSFQQWHTSFSCVCKQREKLLKVAHQTCPPGLACTCPGSSSEEEGREGLRMNHPKTRRQW